MQCCRSTKPSTARSTASRGSSARFTPTRRTAGRWARRRIQDSREIFGAESDGRAQGFEHGALLGRDRRIGERDSRDPSDELFLALPAQTSTYRREIRRDFADLDRGQIVIDPIVVVSLQTLA